MLTEQLRSVRSRGQVKALGRVLDSDADARAAAEVLAKARGYGAVDDLDGKRLVRLLLDFAARGVLRGEVPSAPNRTAGESVSALARSHTFSFSKEQIYA